MNEPGQFKSNQWPEPTGISLRGFYVISVLAMGIGIGVVFVLNFATPTDFVLKQFADLAQKKGFAYSFELVKRLAGLFFLIALSGSPTLLVMHRLLHPISSCLSMVKGGEVPWPHMAEKARRRLINLPFIFIGINVGIWLVAPALVAHGDMAAVVAAGAPRLRLEQRRVGFALVQIGVDDLDQRTAAG